MADMKYKITLPNWKPAAKSPRPNWCDENIGEINVKWRLGVGSDLDSSTYSFAEEKDYLLFILRWM